MILFGSNANLAAALKTADRQGVKAAWFAPFFTADPSTYKLAGDLLDGVYFSSWLLPVASDEPEIKAYRSAVAEILPERPGRRVRPERLEQCRAVRRRLREAADSGKPLTRENLVAALDTLQTRPSAAPASVTFTPGDHRGTRQEAIIQAKNGVLRRWCAPSSPTRRSRSTRNARGLPLNDKSRST